MTAVMSAPLIRSIIEGSPSLSRTSLMRDHIKEPPSWHRAIEVDRGGRGQGAALCATERSRTRYYWKRGRACTRRLVTGPKLLTSVLNAGNFEI